MTGELFECELVTEFNARCDYPYFIVAYWPAGGWWKIQTQLYGGPDCEIIQRDMKELQRKGWCNIRVCKLPF